MDQEQIYKKVIEKFGIFHQLDMVVEECSELIQAIQKWKRNYKSRKLQNNIYEEAADVLIMIEQLKLIFPDVIEKQKERKLKRLEERLNKNTV